MSDYTNVRGAPSKIGNPFNEPVHKLRQQAIATGESYSIKREELLLIIANLGNLEDIAKQSEIDQRFWLDKVAQACLEKMRSNGRTDSGRMSLDNKEALTMPNLFEASARKYGVSSNQYLKAKADVKRKVGSLATIEALRAGFDEWCAAYIRKQNEAKTQPLPLGETPKPNGKVSPFGQPKKERPPEEVEAQMKQAMDEIQAKRDEQMAKLTNDNPFKELETAGETLSALVNQDGQVAVEKSSPVNESAVEGVIEGEVVKQTLSEPSIDEINEYRSEATAIFKATYVNATTEDLARYHHDATGYGPAAHALKHLGKPEALKRCHDFCVTHMKSDVATVIGEGNGKVAETALAIIPEQPTALIPALSTRVIKMPTPEEFQMMQVFAKAVAASGLYRELNTFDKAFVILWKGFELGVGLGAALDGIYIINGRPWPGAQILKAVVMASGMAERFDVVCDDNKAVATVKRKGMDVHTYSFSKQDAVDAGLWGNERTAWPKHPKRMMMHRVSRLAIITDFPDLAAGIGIPLDTEDEDLIDAADAAEQKSEAKIA